MCRVRITTFSIYNIMKKNRISLLLLLLSAWMLQAMAAPVSPAQAEKVAQAFLSKNLKNKAPLKMSRLKSASAIAAATATEPYYVFNAEANGGFVVVSGDDRFASVIAYADRGHFALDDAPSSLRAWMNLYARYVRAYWTTDSLGSAPAALADASVVVSPLLGEINWGQDFPINEQCPTYTDNGQMVHYYTGCVATAATQIMRYHKFPAQGTGTKACVVNGISLSADFGSTTYDWENMLPAYSRTGTYTDAQRKAVSTLAAQFGVAVNMEYAKDGSGASPMMVPGALRDYFGYDRHVVLRKRSYYGTTEWMQIIKAELDAGRPVYYGGASDAGQGGHAFVCDGYDSNDYVHINWGWYGTSNGYFLINRLNPSDLGTGGGSGGYNRDQEMVTGIQAPSESDADVCWPVYGSVRLSIIPYTSNTFSLMTILENLDTNDFEGQLAAVVTRNGEVIKVLKSEALTLKGFANGLSGTAYPTMRDITATADGLADGAYEIRFAIRATGAKDWQIVRHSTGLPRYVDMTVQNGQVSIASTAHAVTPRVELLAPITPAADVHAGGSALFSVKMRNNGDDMQIKSVVVQMTATDGSGITLTGKTSTMVYEQSEGTVSVLVDVPDNAAEGNYQVTAYADGYADHVFDDAKVGRATVSVGSLITKPILGVTQPVEWSGSEGATTIKQNTVLMLGTALRNYGAAGKVGVIMRLEDTSDASHNFAFMQKDVTLSKGVLSTVTMGRYVNVDPGTYKVIVAAVAEDGSTVEVVQPTTPTYVTIEPNDNLLVTVKSLTLDSHLTTGKRVSGQMVVHFNSDFSNYVYLRLRRFTNSGGEIVTMKRVAGDAGTDATITFNYTPDLADGIYMPLIEYKDGSSYVGAGGLANYYREFTMGELTSIDAAQTDAPVSVSPHRVSDVLTIRTVEGVSVNRVVLTTPAGAQVWSGKPTAGTIDLSSMPRGLYVVTIYTNRGAKSDKVVRE